MKFYDPRTRKTFSGQVEEEYRSARQIGAVRVGTGHLFFRSGLRRYCMAYEEIKRCFRRVNSVPAKMCCGKGELQIESLVIADKEGELAQIGLPGSKAARELISELKAKMPGADFSAPKRDENGNIVQEGA
ncbi:MAG: hypothetical protein J5829_03830 [Lachnospiraceae bacterium]|nr:hypothetical protein [Lachnospiraceae bacterium]